MITKAGLTLQEMMTKAGLTLQEMITLKNALVDLAPFTHFADIVSAFATNCLDL
jgi:hypothetical protein